MVIMTDNPIHNSDKLTVYNLTTPTATGVKLKDSPFSVAVPLPHSDSNLEGVEFQGKHKPKLGDIIVVTNKDHDEKEHKCVVVVNDYGTMPKAAIDISAVSGEHIHTSPIADKLGLDIKEKKGKITLEGEGEIKIAVVSHIKDIRHLNKAEHKLLNDALTHVNHHLTTDHTLADIKGMLADRGVVKDKGGKNDRNRIELTADGEPKDNIMAKIAETHRQAFADFGRIVEAKNTPDNSLQLATAAQAQKFHADKSRDSGDRGRS